MKTASYRIGLAFYLALAGSAFAQDVTSVSPAPSNPELRLAQMPKCGLAIGVPRDAKITSSAVDADTTRYTIGWNLADEDFAQAFGDYYLLTGGITIECEKSIISDRSFYADYARQLSEMNLASYRQSAKQGQRISNMRSLTGTALENARIFTSTQAQQNEFGNSVEQLHVVSASFGQSFIFMTAFSAFYPAAVGEAVPKGTIIRSQSNASYKTTGPLVRRPGGAFFAIVDENYATAQMNRIISTLRKM